MSDILVKLHKQPLKYIVTKDKNVLSSPIGDNALVVYEPTNDNNPKSYRELWISNYFLAGGFGAYSQEEQETLSYIAKNYSTSYSYFNDRIEESFNYSKNLYDLLDENKVSSGDSITNKGSDISFNTFNFGEENIALCELYNKFNEIHMLYKFEIYNIEYWIKVEGYNNWFNNFSTVPIGSKVIDIKFKITGNTKDSGGIDDIQITLFNQYNNLDTFDFTLLGLDYAQEDIPTTSNCMFELEFHKKFGSSDQYHFVISENDDLNKNYIIKDIIIITKPSDNDNLINPLSGEIISDIIQKYPSYFYAGDPLYVFKGLKNNKRMIGNYNRYLITNKYELNISETENIKHISLLLNSNLRLLKAEYEDLLQCQTYDIIDFILTNYNVNQNYTGNKTFAVEYIIDITNNTNYNSNLNGNPPFLHEKLSNLYLNKGKITFTFITSDVNNEPVLQNTSQYWISYDNSNELPLDLPL